MTRTHVAMASTEEDRHKAIGLTSLLPAVGLLLGFCAINIVDHFLNSFSDQRWHQLSQIPGHTGPFDWHPFEPVHGTNAFWAANFLRGPLLVDFPL